MTFCVVDFFRPMNTYRTKARMSKLISVGTSAPMPDYYYEDEIKVSAAIVMVYAMVLAMAAAASEIDSGVGDERTG